MCLRQILLLWISYWGKGTQKPESAKRSRRPGFSLCRNPASCPFFHGENVMGTRLANSSENTFSHYLIFKSISVKARPKSDNCKCIDTNVSNTGHEELTAHRSHKDKGTDGVWAVYKRLCFCIAKLFCCGRHTRGLCVCVLFIHTQLRKPQLLVTTMSQGTPSNWSDVAHKLN